MTYMTPELLTIGSAKQLVLGAESDPNPFCGPIDNVGGRSWLDELW
jgi:hypothetical protein